MTGSLNTRPPSAVGATPMGLAPAFGAPVPMGAGWRQTALTYRFPAPGQIAPFTEDGDVRLVRHLVAAPWHRHAGRLIGESTIEALDAPIPGVGDIETALDVASDAYGLLEPADAGALQPVVFTRSVGRRACS